MTDTSPPAFPNPEVRGPDVQGFQAASWGMSLRDYFAGQALVGIIAHHGSGNCDQDARRAYETADEMIKQRECAE